MDPISEFLEINGPALSSDIARHLICEKGMSPAAARKRVSRGGQDLKRLQGLVFPHKASFVYLNHQFASHEYWDNLTDALIVTNSAYGFAIAALRQRGGIVSERQFSIVCGSPVRQQRQLSPETILARLRNANLVRIETVPGIGDCVALIQRDGEYRPEPELMRARLITEGIVLAAVKDWLRNLGIASYDKVALRTDEDLPRVGTFVWDLSAPCYLGHMVRTKADGRLTPGFIACDIYHGEEMTEAGVAPFIRKCTMLRALRKVGPCMQILLAERFTPGAFRMLKSCGVIPATPKSLFGEEIAEALSELTSVLHRAAHSAIDPARFEILFSKLSKIDGATSQLRGTLFEFMSGEIARLTIASDIRLNQNFQAPSKEGHTDARAEADVVAVDRNKLVTLIECKGYSPWATVPEAEFDRWLEHNVPTCYAALRRHPDFSKLALHFEFWSTAALSDESLAKFERAKAAIRPTRYTIDLKLGPDVRKTIKGTRDKGLLTAFDKHFVRDEMTPAPHREPDLSLLKQD